MREIKKNFWFQNSNNFNDRYLSFEILSKILVSIPSLNSSTHLCRETSISIIPQLIEIVLKRSSDTPELIPPAIHCLNSCISSFSGSCGPKRHLIEKFIINCMKNVSYLPNTDCQTIKVSFYFVESKLYFLIIIIVFW